MLKITLKDQIREIILWFIDSYKFLNTSLDKLAFFLKKMNFEFYNANFKIYPKKTSSCWYEKGLFHMNTLRWQAVRVYHRANHSTVPWPVTTVSESVYVNAMNVWQQFSVQTLSEYSDLYLKTDVLLLADIFENFRDKCIESITVSLLLSYAYYYFILDFTDAMLKHIRINFELLTDIDMVIFIERGICGGFSQCSSRYARANNKYMQLYDSS